MREVASVHIRSIERKGGSGGAFHLLVITGLTGMKWRVVVGCVPFVCRN